MQFNVMTWTSLGVDAVKRHVQDADNCLHRHAKHRMQKSLLFGPECLPSKCYIELIRILNLTRLALVLTITL